MTKFSKIQKYSKGRYINHSKVIVISDILTPVSIIQVVSSPQKINNAYTIVKSAVVKTNLGLIKIVNKTAHSIPLGIKI